MILKAVPKLNELYLECVLGLDNLQFALMSISGLPDPKFKYQDMRADSAFFHFEMIKRHDRR